MPEDALAEDAFPEDGLGRGGEPTSLPRALCEPDDGGLLGRDEGAPERFLESCPLAYAMPRIAVQALRYTTYRESNFSMSAWE